MSKKQKHANEKNNMIIIIIAFVMLLILILAITIFITLYFHKNIELSWTNENILYYSENEKQEGENNLIIVGINDTNESNNYLDNKKNETNITNNDTKSNVNIPYYIKVNNDANVVTVYKKDSFRKLHSSSTSNALLYWKSYTRKPEYIQHQINTFGQFFREMSMDNMPLG